MKINEKFLLIAFIPLLFTFPACQKETASWQGTVEEREGVAVVKNPIDPLNPEMQIVFEEDLTIGVEEGDENYMFGSEVFVTADDEGNFYISDVEMKIIKKYDPEGQYLTSIGRPGQGPGEFQHVSEARFDADGNIYLYDFGNKRISFLSKEGSYIKSLKVSADIEGRLIITKDFFVAAVSDNVQEEQSRKWDVVYGLFDDEFNIVEEFFRLPQEFKMPTGRDEDSIVEFLAGGLSVMAFKPEANYVLDQEENVLFGYPDKYEINVYNPNGKLEKTIQRNFKPIKISEEYKEDFLERQGEPFMALMPKKTQQLKKKIFSSVKYPKYKPAYEQFVLMENGWIIVVVDSVPNEAKIIDIFSKDGKYLAQFEADIYTEKLFFNNGKAYAVATEDDYKLIKRYSFKISGYEQ